MFFLVSHIGQCLSCQHSYSQSFFAREWSRGGKNTPSRVLTSNAKLVELLILVDKVLQRQEKSSERIS